MLHRFVAAGGIEPLVHVLVAMLREGSAEEKVQASRAVFILAQGEGGDANTAAIDAAGGVEPLVAMYREDSAKEKVTFSIAGLALAALFPIKGGRAAAGVSAWRIQRRLDAGDWRVDHAGPDGSGALAVAATAAHGKAIAATEEAAGGRLRVRTRGALRACE